MHTSTTGRGAGSRPRGTRGLVLSGAILVALISTVSAYLAMVQFGIDILGMRQDVAYTTAGVFELSLVNVALMAREAARDNRPGGTLLTLTWGLSTASGVFAAWHELYIGHPLGAALFRFVVPLLAALMWHLALIGDRHLATGRSWSSLRQTARMHALFLSTEDLFRAQSLNDGTRTARRRLARAEAARRRARAVALRTVPPQEMREQVTAWIGALRALGDGTADVATLHAQDSARLASILTLPPATSAGMVRESTPPDTDTDTDVDEGTADTVDDVAVVTAGDTITDNAHHAPRESALSGDVVSDTFADTSAVTLPAEPRDEPVESTAVAMTRRVKRQVRAARSRQAQVRELREAKTPDEIAEILGVSERTIYRDLDKLDADDSSRDTAIGDSDGRPRHDIGSDTVGADVMATTGAR